MERDKLDKTYMNMARELSKLSHAQRRKVGCLIVKDTHIIAEGINGTSSQGATLYVTCSPCFDCAKLIIQSGIERVVYDEEYSKSEGLSLLNRAGIGVEKI